jgi:sec-independent protein translocase protein TatC
VPSLLKDRKARPSPDAMTLAEHLAELRRRLVICVVAFTLLALFSAIFYNWMVDVLRNPYCAATHDPHCSFLVTGPLDPLQLRVELAAFGGLVLASPVVLWELWRFITPGLRPKEKHYAIPFVASLCVFFLLGCATAFVIFPHAISWLVAIGGTHLTVHLNPTSYLTLILWLMLLFGLAFEFPVLLVALQLVGVVSPGQLLRAWRWSVLGIVVGAGVFTPSSDPFSMLALAVPLIAFYFGAIGVGKLLGR